MTIMTVKTREWGVGYHYGRLTAVSDHATVYYGRHMVWKPLLGGIAYFKHKLRESIETNAPHSCGSCSSGNFLKIIILH